ncbi:hypothetical protein AVEN_133163-1 [Araneus ventricosus]|uniref:Uncharacterized protein n=1 Tax=Araneus ventricosus TaxID=182803 RepID=A0A4Y2JHN9_ARAVE|nr:hypothetical protein AVEN_133163-1 [Araneus ventricosus]
MVAIWYKVRLLVKRSWYKSKAARTLHPPLEMRDACWPVPRLCIRPSSNVSYQTSNAGFQLEQCVFQLPYNPIYCTKKVISPLHCYVIPTHIYGSYCGLD